MLIYARTKATFLSDVRSGRIVSAIEQAFMEKGLHHENTREAAAWEHSLAAVSDVLESNRFSDDLLIALEYQIPQTSKRVDLIIAGEDDNGHPHMILVELKQ